MLPQPRPAELERDPTEMGEPVIGLDPHPKPRDAEPNEKEEFPEANKESSVSSENVTDEDIDSEKFKTLLEAHSAHERGGHNEEVEIVTDFNGVKFDGKYESYFNNEGIRIDTKTGMPVIRMAEKYYREVAKKSEEEIAVISQRSREIDKDLFENRNSFRRINDWVEKVNGKETLRVGYSFTDSQGRVSTFDIRHTPATESAGANGGEPAEDITGVGNEGVSLPLEANDNLSEEDIFGISYGAETEASEVVEDVEVDETEEVEQDVVPVSINTEKDFETVQRAIFSEPQPQPVSLETKAGAVDLIKAALTEEFGFEYVVEEQAGTEISAVLPVAVPIVEPIRIVFLDDVEKPLTIVTPETSAVQEVSQLQPAAEVIKEVAVVSKVEEGVGSVLVEITATDRVEIVGQKADLEISNDIARDELVVEQAAPTIQVHQQRHETAPVVETATTEVAPVAKTVDAPKSAEVQMPEVRAEIRPTDRTVSGEIKTMPSAEVSPKVEMSDVAQIEVREFPVHAQEQEARIPRSVETAKEIEMRAEAMHSIAKNTLPLTNSLDRFVVGTRSASLAQYAEATNDNTNMEIVEVNGITMRRYLRAA